ncbi:hypothetical protein [Nonomuraea sp. NPDC050202]|uniref:hypothetical protein n=1 Tax=Nonomuraea sp. NPDC050202 TaxID=3155035 RepID=UPI0033EA3F57
MFDLSSFAAFIVLIVGSNLLTWAITRGYYQSFYGVFQAALRRLVEAAGDDDCRDLDHALAYADDVLDRRPT